MQPPTAKGLMYCSSQARKLGPFSSAKQLVEARGAVAAAREEKILEAARGQLEAQDAVAWAPSRDVALGPRKACRVDPLFSLSLSLIVEYLEDVETLVGLPDAIKVGFLDQSFYCFLCPTELL